MNAPEFRGFQKIARLSREMVITEKIDGTNGVIYVPELNSEDCVWAGSKSRWLSPSPKANDNFGFAAWVADNAVNLTAVLGPGYHYGEWWGSGIQRRYGLDHKRFSLFNPFRYAESPMFNSEARPVELGVVPILYTGPWSDYIIGDVLTHLGNTGSIAAPGFPVPEGIVIYHTASKTLFKKTFDGDELPRGAVDA